MTDPHVEFDGETIRQSSRLIFFHKEPDGSGVTLATTGWYRDEFVRTGDGWKTRRRQVQPDTARSRVPPRFASQVASIRGPPASKAQSTT